MAPGGGARNCTAPDPDEQACQTSQRFPWRAAARAGTALHTGLAAQARTAYFHTRGNGSFSLRGAPLTWIPMMAAR